VHELDCIRRTVTVSRDSLQPLSEVVDLDRKHRAKREVSYWEWQGNYQQISPSDVLRPT